jgi:hypothetical protein
VPLIAFLTKQNARQACFNEFIIAPQRSDCMGRLSLLCPIRVGQGSHRLRGIRSLAVLEKKAYDWAVASQFNAAATTPKRKDVISTEQSQPHLSLTAA